MQTAAAPMATTLHPTPPHNSPMRTFSAALFNSIANDPRVRPWLGGSGELELSGLISNPANFAFQLGDAGGFLVCPIFAQTYEVHTLFSPDDRDSKAIVGFMQRCMEWMFCRTECVELVCRVPEGHLGAEWLAGKGGFEFVGVQQNWSGGKSATLRRVWLESWARSSAAAAAAGCEFHELLAGAKELAGSELPEHPDDLVHDAMVGAALLMAGHGRVVKGVNMYNHWAAIAGYAQVRLVSEAPAVVDVGDALIGVGAGGMEVLLCR